MITMVMMWKFIENRNGYKEMFCAYILCDGRIQYRVLQIGMRRLMLIVTESTQFA